MEMSSAEIRHLAEQLLAAEEAGTTIGLLSEVSDALDLAAAYAIQDAALALREERGETCIGVKLGLTSRAKQVRMGIDAPLTAWLTDAMLLPSGALLPSERLIHPRVEPEIAFVMGQELSGPGVSGATALASVSAVHAALEVIDSRYDDYQFTLADVVADNASSAGFVLGPVSAPPAGMDLSLEGCLLSVDGAVTDSATGAAVQGHPAEALALAANTLAERGHRIRKGWIVLAGALTDAVPTPPGQTVMATFTRLGVVAVSG